MSTEELEDGFYAEIWDDNCNNVLATFGPYQTAGQAKGMATRKHKETGRYTAWAEVSDGVGVDGDVWPQIHSNGYEGGDEDVAPPVIKGSLSGIATGKGGKKKPPVKKGNMSGGARGSSSIGTEPPPEPEGKFIQVGDEKIRILNKEDRQLLNRYWLVQALTPKAELEPPRRKKRPRRHRRRKANWQPKQKGII